MEIKCGSGLARECGVSAHKKVADTPHSRASPLPHFDRCSVSVTTVEEQRGTEWMKYQSLSDFLDPEDHSKTIEGLPAPMRAVIVAKK